MHNTESGHGPKNSLTRAHAPVQYYGPLLFKFLDNCGDPVTITRPSLTEDDAEEKALCYATCASTVSVHNLCSQFGSICIEFA